MKKNSKKPNNRRHKIIMKISEALERLASVENSNFRKELSIYPPNYWLVEGDELNERGKPQFFIFEDTPENNRVLSGHTPIDLNYGISL